MQELILGNVDNTYLREIDYEYERISQEDQSIIHNLDIPWEKLSFKGIVIFNSRNDRDDIGCYIHGTYQYPHILVNLHYLKNNTISHQEYIEAIHLTILHELYHGLEDLHDFEYNCDHAEEFAKKYLFDGIAGWHWYTHRKDRRFIVVVVFSSIFFFSFFNFAH